jgi:hypothetical protein
MAGIEDRTADPIKIDNIKLLEKILGVIHVPIGK